MFRRFVEYQLARVRQCSQAGMLGDGVYEKLESALKRLVELIAGSTTTHMISQAVTDNPFATAFPDLITDAERAQALDTIREQLDSGAMTLPEPLVECLELQLGSATSALLEALDRLVEHRDEICDALLAGRRFQTIDDVDLATGDTHNCERSVTIFHTDAEALIAAADVLDDGRYLSAAAEALDYEIDAYRRYEKKFGTWADLREFPPVKYMHGYCAGAPGTGIVVNRILEEGRGDAKAQAIARLARQSVDMLPLTPFDHLCCGNSAVAEYYLSVGDHEAAGRVLGTICGHGLHESGRQDPISNASGNAVATLFNGVSGVGYELLRYAYPETILSVL